MSPLRIVWFLVIMLVVGLGTAFRLNHARLAAEGKGFAPARKDEGNPAWDLLSRARALLGGRSKPALNGDALDALKSGDVDKLIASLDEAIREEPDDPYLYCLRAFGYQRKKDYARAIDDLDRAIRLEEGTALFYEQRGSVYRDMKDYDRAIKDHTETIRLDPEGPDGYLARGLDYEKKHDFNDALADYERAARLTEDSPEAGVSLALFLASCPRKELRDGPRAVDLATKACEQTEWTDPESLAALAAARAEVGEFEAAVKWQKKALEQLTGAEDPEDVAAAKARLKLYGQGKPYRLK